MPYVERDGDKIIAVFREANERASEKLPLDSPELLAFISDQDEQTMVENQLFQSDLQMARVVEDLIELLLAKDVVHITDFPLAVIRKLRERQGVRGQLSCVAHLFNAQQANDD